jgi:excisionase family DNA binding protein
MVANMKILTLKEAADLLRMHPEILRLKVVKGLIPAAKPAGRWIFRLEDLDQYLKSIYSDIAKASLGVIETPRRSKKWRSINEVIRGGLTSDSKDLEYRKALGLRTE